jgi:hypothetical protein
VGDRRDGLGLLRRPQAGSYRTQRGNVISADTRSSSIEKCARQPIRSALGRSPLAGDRRDGLGLSVARKRAPTDSYALSSGRLPETFDFAPAEADADLGRDLPGQRGTEEDKQLRVGDGLAGGFPSAATSASARPRWACGLPFVAILTTWLSPRPRKCLTLRGRRSVPHARLRQIYQVIHSCRHATRDHYVARRDPTTTQLHEPDAAAVRRCVGCCVCDAEPLGERPDEAVRYGLGEAAVICKTGRPRR